mmetsp:Transcript_21880/g.32605  ORF Transcript_21880/g.32605 Transcript_21880/m.32605 type:complete len:298 (-) Transcript_21880:40-933(-)
MMSSMLSKCLLLLSLCIIRATTSPSTAVPTPQPSVTPQPSPLPTPQPTAEPTTSPTPAYIVVDIEFTVAAPCFKLDLIVTSFSNSLSLALGIPESRIVGLAPTCGSVIVKGSVDFTGLERSGADDFIDQFNDDATGFLTGHGSFIETYGSVTSSKAEISGSGGSDNDNDGISLTILIVIIIAAFLGFLAIVAFGYCIIRRGKQRTTFRQGKGHLDSALVRSSHYMGVENKSEETWNPNATSTTSFYMPPQPAPVPQKRNLPDNWSSHYTSVGQEFFYNKVTGESRWELPLAENPTAT